MTEDGVADRAGQQPTEEELRAAYEAQVKQIRVEQIVLENVVTVLNLGMRRTGMAPGTEDERDPDQVRVAIESVRVQLPLLEQSAAQPGAPDPRRAVSAPDGLREDRRPARGALLGGGREPAIPGGRDPRAAASPAGADEPAAGQPRRSGPGAAQRAPLGARAVAAVRSGGLSSAGPERGPARYTRAVPTGPPLVTRVAARLLL